MWVLIFFTFGIWIGPNFLHFLVFGRVWFQSSLRHPPPPHTHTHHHHHHHHHRRHIVICSGYADWGGAAPTAKKCRFCRSNKTETEITHQNTITLESYGKLLIWSTEQWIIVTYILHGHWMQIFKMHLINRGCVSYVKHARSHDVASRRIKQSMECEVRGALCIYNSLMGTCVQFNSLGLAAKPGLNRCLFNLSVHDSTKLCLMSIRRRSWPAS